MDFEKEINKLYLFLNLINHAKSDIINITENSNSEEREDTKMTTKDLEEMKASILRKIRTAEKEILKDFLCKVKQIEGYLNRLNQEGIDRERYICIKGHEEWKDISYSKVDDYSLIALLALFREMKEDEKAISTQFESISAKEREFLMNYEEYFDLEKMEDAYNALKRAEEEMESLIL